MATPIISWEQEVLRLLKLISDGGTGGSNSDFATSANQQLAIASLESLDFDNATEGQQVAIKNAIDAMQAALLADNASQTKQQELIDRLSEIKNAIAPSARSTPDFTATATNGTVAAGAKAIKFTIPTGTNLTVNGKPVPSYLATLEWGFNPGGYSAMPYEVSGGEVVITTSY